MYYNKRSINHSRILDYLIIHDCPGYHGSRECGVLHQIWDYYAKWLFRYMYQKVNGFSSELWLARVCFSKCTVSMGSGLVQLILKNLIAFPYYRLQILKWHNCMLCTFVCYNRKCKCYKKIIFYVKNPKLFI